MAKTPSKPRTTWYVAPALETLRLQLNTLFPNRSKVSDGGIGDENHASRKSDHNPWVKDSKGVGVVTARDFTHDPANGLDCNDLAKALIKHRDPRIKYIIWNRQICSSLISPWKWRPYSGVNAHAHHLHLSVNEERKFWQDAKAWDLSGLQGKTEPIGEVARVLPDPEPISAAAPETDNRGSVTEDVPAGENDPAASGDEPASSALPPTIVTTVSDADGTSVGVVSAAPAGGTDPRDSFQANIPQIDTARSWMARLLTGTGLGVAVTYFTGMPQWLQITLVSFIGLLIVGAIVLFVTYHREVFAYVTQMNTLRAQPGTGNPIVSGRPATKK